MIQDLSSGIGVVVVKSKLLETNFVYRIVALVLSIALWVGISVADNPIEQKIISVPIEYLNLPDDQMIVRQEDAVNVRIEGRVEDLEFVHAQDMKAQVDLSRTTSGSHLVALDVKVPSSVSLVEVKPDEVQVFIDDVRSAQLPVVASVSGSPREGYEALEPSLSPGEVLVEAPQNILDILDQVAVNVILNYESNYKKNLPLVVTDIDGKDITDKVRLNPEVIEVTVPIFAQNSLLEKPVYVPILGMPKEGYSVVGVQATPDRVEISGEFAAFQNIIYYATEAVDVSGKKDTFSIEIPIINDNEFVQIRPLTIEVVVRIEKN